MRSSCLLLLLALAALAQEPASVASPDFDLQDDLVLKNTLYVSITAEDIYRDQSTQQLASLQAEQMMEASQRRMARQEKRVDDLRARVEQGEAPAEELKAAIQEMNRRIEIGYLALSRATVLQDIVRSAEAERKRAARGRGPTERYDGGRPFTPAVLRSVETAFQRKFGHPLPISAEGDTALHRALGLDHSGRVDVAVHPDQPEGIWLRSFLSSQHIPYYGFRMAILGSATAPHIHIGPGSVRYRQANAGTRPEAAPRRTASSGY